MCNSGIPRGEGRDVCVDHEASRQDIGRGTEPKHWMLTCSRGSPGSCRAAPEQSLSLTAAAVLQ